ncbi:uncharacterized protein F5Z01DRAFT_287705 [Emericellopsis atlantica]|uniref:Uncharacterized protein n=1 Tax=Emericellopsis atlantica TaxID=2614577 RepID=A0A9P8CN09_9HYPO|nr:uncharacterized protein F5Z01DRAFT_287705 [Emericellopsis atlantica]KAG9251251.1 hypothetical protein F5Z01DRAFT_287705 [Emericellopsis atlantica]
MSRIRLAWGYGEDTEGGCLHGLDLFLLILFFFASVRWRRMHSQRVGTYMRKQTDAVAATALVHVALGTGNTNATYRMPFLGHIAFVFNCTILYSLFRQCRVRRLCM